MTIAHLLPMNTDIEAQKAFDQLARVGFEKLTDSEKILAAVWTYQAGVANGGFVRYFNSAAGDMAFYVPAALGKIGSMAMAGIAAEANQVFGSDGPPKNREARRAIVQTFSDEIRKKLTALEDQFYASPEDADEYLDLYLNPKP